MATKKNKGQSFESVDFIEDVLAAATRSRSVEDLVREEMERSGSVPPTANAEKTAELPPQPEKNDRIEAPATADAELSPALVKQTESVTEPKPASGFEKIEQVEASGLAEPTENPANTSVTETETQPAAKRKTESTSGGRERKRGEKADFMSTLYRQDARRQGLKPDMLKRAYLDPITHARIELLLKYAKLTKTKTSMQDITANIIESFLLLHKEEWKEMQEVVNAANKKLEF